MLGSWGSSSAPLPRSVRCPLSAASGFRGNKHQNTRASKTRQQACVNGHAMDNLTPQDLFSPSKARQQRAQAADWAQIDSWLSYKYAGRTVPTFERNEETLKVLRELSLANERADEERMIMERVEREACKELEADEVWW